MKTKEELEEAIKDTIPNYFWFGYFRLYAMPRRASKAADH